jgi:hypothetical protein
MSADVQQLADRIAQVCEGEPLGVQGTALSLNLAAVVAGYAPPKREAVSQAFAELVRNRVDQLAVAATQN